MICVVLEGVPKCSPSGLFVQDVFFDKLRRCWLVAVDSERSSGSPTPCDMANEFTGCRVFRQRVFGAVLLSLTWGLVKHTFMQQIEDEPYKLASAKDTRPLVVMRGGLAVFGLVEVAELVVMRP